jgi:hypothetical protein
MNNTNKNYNQSLRTPDKLNSACKVLNIAVCLRGDRIFKWEGNEESSIVELTDEEYQLVDQQFETEMLLYNNVKYVVEREKEYPSLPEQLDMQYWDAINGTTTWQDAINAVKAKYPKPTES